MHVGWCLRTQVLESSQYLRWREWSFLSNPKVPRTVLWSESSLWYHTADEALPEVYATSAHTHALDDAQLLRVVDGLHAKIVHVRNMQPGAFLGFASSSRNAEFDAWFRRMMHDLKWCCATQIEDYKRQRFDSIDFPVPHPLDSSTPSPFKVRARTRMLFTNTVRLPHMT